MSRVSPGANQIAVKDHREIGHDAGVIKPAWRPRDWVPPSVSEPFELDHVPKRLVESWSSKDFATESMLMGFDPTMFFWDINEMTFDREACYPECPWHPL